MTTIKINGTKYAVPASWHDISVERFMQLVRYQPSDDVQDFFNRMSIVTSIPVKVLEQLDYDSVELLKLRTDFINDMTALEGVTFYPIELEGFKVGEQPSKTILGVQGCLTRARKMLPDEPDGSALLWLVCGQEITEIYLESAGVPQDISQEPITRWYGVMCFFLNRSVHFSVATLTSTITKRLRTKSKQASRTYQLFHRISAWLKRLPSKVTKRGTRF